MTFDPSRLAETAHVSQGVPRVPAAPPDDFLDR